MMTESIIRPVINISSILSTLPDSSIDNIYQKLVSDYNIPTCRLITAALLSITADKSFDWKKLETDITGIRDSLQENAKQTLKSVNTSLLENCFDGSGLATYMATFWTDTMFNTIINLNKRFYVIVNTLRCIASVNSSKQLSINSQTNSKIHGYNKYQLTRMYHHINSFHLLFNMVQRRRECDFPSSLEKEDFEVDMSSNVIHALSKLKNIAIGEDSFVMIKKENLNQIVKNNKHLHELTLSLTNANYRNDVKVDAISSFLNHANNPAASSDQLKLKTMKIEYKSDGSDNSRKIASVAIEHSFVKNVCHLNLLCFQDDSGALNNVKFPQTVAEKNVEVLTLPKTCTIDLQSQNNKDIQSQLCVKKLIFELSTKRAKDGIRLIMNEYDSFKYGFDQFVTEQNKSDHLYAINKFNESLNFQNSVITAVINVDIELLDSSIDAMLDIFWGNEYARYRNRFLKLNKLTLFGFGNGHVTVSNVRKGKELLQRYTNGILNNISTLKHKSEKNNKLTPTNLNSFTTQAKVVVRIDDFNPARTPISPRDVNITCKIPSIRKNSKTQLKQTIIPRAKTTIRKILNELEQNGVNEWNNQMILVWHVNIDVKCEL